MTDDSFIVSDGVDVDEDAQSIATSGGRGRTPVIVEVVPVQSPLSARRSGSVPC